jgi:hypothetical protein
MAAMDRCRAQRDALESELQAMGVRLGLIWVGELWCEGGEGGRGIVLELH